MVFSSIHFSLQREEIIIKELAELKEEDMNEIIWGDVEKV